MLAAWGDSTEEEEGSEEEEAAVALVARSESDSDDESIEDLDQLKNKAQVGGEQRCKQAREQFWKQNREQSVLVC